MMNPTTRIYMFILGLTVLIFVINMVRTRRLQERYALLWVLAGVAPDPRAAVHSLAGPSGLRFGFRLPAGAAADAGCGRPVC